MGDFASWNEFLRNGTLGPIALGMPLEDVPKILGKPKGSYNRRGWEGYDYEIVRFAAYEKRIITISLIHFLLDAATPLPKPLSISSPFDPGTTRQQVIAYLNAEGIPWKDASIEGIDGLHIGRCVSAVFSEAGTLESLMAQRSAGGAKEEPSRT
ncbi:MAG TPA: hypothetical protein VM680_09480 [Verrucomicrobiae bacterium]|nr:hypothetical protein [Verrucomicrobiae bacterium]